MRTKRRMLVGAAVMAIACAASCGRASDPPVERVSTISAPLSEWHSQTGLTASDGTQSDHFGSALALSRDGGVTTLIVGAAHDTGGPHPSPLLTAPGEAYLFELEAGTWTERQKLVASDGVPDDWFGRAVAIDGDTAVVGAPFYGDTQAPGVAYVFERSGGVWTEMQKLVPSDGIVDDFFGAALALEGDVLVVGARQGRFFVNELIGPGAVYVFARTGGTFVETQKLSVANGNVHDELGAALALDGSTLLAGAPGDDNGASNSGSLYVFTETGGVWTEERRVDSPVPSTSAAFGTTVSRSGSTVVVGTVFAAAAEVYDASAWTHRASLTSPLVLGLGGFGRSVGVQGDTIVVGGPFVDVGTNNSGVAHVFVRDAGNWTLEHTLHAPVPGPSEWFGHSLALVDGLVVIGAPNDDELTLNGNEGAAYAFTLVGGACATSTDCGGKLCVDGYCCDVACDSPCARCDATGSEGRCAPAPHGDPGAPSCGLNVCDGTALTCPDRCIFDSDCAAGAYCDDASAPPLCRAIGNSGTECDDAQECASGYCIDGVCCESACADACRRCNVAGQQGTCAIAPLGDETTCFPYACDGLGSDCPDACSDDSQCAPEHICDLTTGDCSNSPECDGEHTLKNPDRTEQDCRPYRCNTSDLCNTTCQTSSDCARGSVCDADGRCVSESSQRVIQSCACVAGPRRALRWPWLLAIPIVLAARRRRRGAAT